jgi:Tfp pilus assembly protein PilV
MYRASSKKRGFTILEALVSAFIVVVGIVSTVQVLGAMTKTDYRVRETEKIQRLAVAKFDEVLATGAVISGALNGNFDDWDLTGYTWEAEVVGTGVNNLDMLKVTVTNPNNFSVEIDGLQYVPPVTDTTTGATQ